MKLETLKSVADTESYHERFTRDLTVYRTTPNRNDT